jgi:hypothetical protein
MITCVQLVYPIYKNELYGAELGASAFALDVAMRYIFSSVFPLFAIQMIKKINETWTITLFAFVLIALAPVPWVLQKWGPTLRSKSKYVAMAQGSNPVPTEELRNS